jgi:hypothetical protein
LLLVGSSFMLLRQDLTVDGGDSIRIKSCGAIQQQAALRRGVKHPNHGVLHGVRIPNRHERPKIFQYFPSSMWTISGDNRRSTRERFNQDGWQTLPSRREDEERSSAQPGERVSHEARQEHMTLNPQFTSECHDPFSFRPLTQNNESDRPVGSKKREGTQQRCEILLRNEATNTKNYWRPPISEPWVRSHVACEFGDPSTVNCVVNNPNALRRQVRRVDKIPADTFRNTYDLIRQRIYQRHHPTGPVSARYRVIVADTVMLRDEYASTAHGDPPGHDANKIDVSQSGDEPTRALQSQLMHKRRQNMTRAPWPEDTWPKVGRYVVQIGPFRSHQYQPNRHPAPGECRSKRQENAFSSAAR